ncbi:MAG: hypothetical protein A2402_01385 [Candidatus Staskawiczbacteria bacterium RIFOXYC1_FULL_37_43]|nr:MAG: hypothetical protein A2813_02880 [Candidatus Staskawiczbacteria bacterium RIFCSPHIGHO2_01_FULL_37_17]OGZ71711.1 MAG: hypothetical protein A2891_00175 [Candidatus Staskawiczbacteria bacterium RIFCSPLOWO2_01_FULL_37_19]OGZ75405.1 MAG: hypothetical protein A2205_01525 [Candidatus Staskawiczbacteria bacterium RIFOXYA1_FULL_37_15]OGZ77986.1 MAG: hypothetical protein A2280_00155 [Candidatus Staskawiczbacteria bacterium RIFOXYA12_FULL_37_10]OGZ80856.1 MAG: hypothetical protein A2353_01290 [Can
MDVKKVIVSGLLAGLVIFIASMLASKIFGVIFPWLDAEYQNESIFRPWTDPLMLLYFAYPFLLGIILAWFWQKTKSIFGENIKGGVNFGVVYWAITSIPGMFITYSSFQVSLLMIISWSVAGLIGAVLAGIVFVKLDSPMLTNKI